MTHATKFIEKATKFFEATQSSFVLKKPVLGWGFTEEKRATLPKGEYIVVEPDDRDKNRLIVSKKKTYELYAILKTDIPNPKDTKKG